MTVRVYPTHLRQAGDLVVHLPAGIDADGNSHSPEVVISDAGADIDDALAEQLIRFRDATTDAPASIADIVASGTRAELNAAANDAGVESPEDLATKADVAQAIVDAG